MDQEGLKELLRKEGLKVTKQRLLVLAAVADHPGEHLTAEEIHGLVRKQYPVIGLATIYRAVQLLVDLHVIDRVSFDDGVVRYEMVEPHKDCRHHHHHAICQRCGSVRSFEDDLLEPLEQALYDAIGFVVTDHEVKLYGYCKECAKLLKKDKNETKQ